MRFLIILTILYISISEKLIAQSYSGTIVNGKSSLHYRVKLVDIEDQKEAFFSSVEMNAYEIPCQNTTFDKDSLKFYLVSDYYTYEYKYSQKSNNYKGQLIIYANENEQLLNTFETNLIEENKTEPDLIKKQDLFFTSNDLKLFGTLWKPKNSRQQGLVFVTSSQGNDRSSTNAEAYYFANLGYTVFNYDKRGTGKSEGHWQSATIEELCADDINAITFFAKTTMLPIPEIGIKGSSQGGIKIPYILTKMPNLKFGISISCPGGTLLESDLNYWKNVNIDKIGHKNINIAAKVQKAGYDYLANNLSYKKLNSIKNKYENEDWFKYVWIPDENTTKDYKLNFSGLPYFKKITQPVLVIQGESDKVIPENSYLIIEKALKKSESKKYEILTLENTTHSMTYLDKEFPYFQRLSPKYLISVAEWLNKI